MEGEEGGVLGGEGGKGRIIAVSRAGGARRGRDGRLCVVERMRVLQRQW